MSSVYRILSAAIIILTVATPTAACRDSLENRLAKGYAGQGFSAIVLAKIEQAKPTADPITRSWEASATITRVFRGEYRSKELQFRRGPDSCEAAGAPPKRGSLWVVYLWKPAKGEQRVWNAYPFDKAYAADPHLSLGANLQFFSQK